MPHPPTVTAAEHLHGLDATGLRQTLAQAFGIEAFLPAMHRAVLVVVRHAHQIGQLMPPDHATGFGDAAGTAVEHSIDQLSAVDQHQGPGRCDGLTGAGGFGLHPQIHLTGHRGLHIPTATAPALLQGVGACRHRLGLQRGERPGVGHLTADHTRQVGLDAEGVDNPQLAAATADLELTPVTALPQPDAAGIGGGDLQQAAGRQAAPFAIQLRLETTAAEVQRQPPQLAGAAGQATHLQGHIGIGPQGQSGAFVQQHPHLRFPPQRDRHRRRDNADRGATQQGEERSETHSTNESAPV